jgi:hypothetical protein
LTSRRATMAAKPPGSGGGGTYKGRFFSDTTLTLLPFSLAYSNASKDSGFWDLIVNEPNIVSSQAIFRSTSGQKTGVLLLDHCRGEGTENRPAESGAWRGQAPATAHKYLVMRAPCGGHAPERLRL